MFIYGWIIPSYSMWISLFVVDFFSGLHPFLWIYIVTFISLWVIILWEHGLMVLFFIYFFI